MHDVGDFPDLIRLRDEDGEVTGLFSDHGSWFGVTWGERGTFELHLHPGERHAGREILHLGAATRSRRVYADRLEVELENGARAMLGFVSDEALVVEYRHEQPPEPGSTLPFAVTGAGAERWLVVVLPGGGGVRNPDTFGANRTRWNEMFRRGFHGNLYAGWAPAERAIARAITVLGWNWRAPRGDLRHAGVVPSPFGYPGFWAWDSWKHAHALATLEPWLAAEQLRAQFQRQARDGQVPDTCMPQRGHDNWRNGKPPLAAWALEALFRQTGDVALLRELYAPCAAQLAWFDRARRREDQPLAVCGGVDRETAMWDSGWDESRRFEDVPLRKGRKRWRLFDLWQPDLNAYLYLESRAMARLAPVAGMDAGPWEQDAGRIGGALRDHCFDGSRGVFADRRVDEEGNPGAFGLCSAACWLPVWAGAATGEQAASVRRALADPERFATPLPFPTLASDSPGFDPDDYWNGGVWFDHAALAAATLEAGERGSAREPVRALLACAADGPNLFECYSPRTAAPCAGTRPAVPQFSWTAAAILEMARGGPAPGAEQPGASR